MSSKEIKATILDFEQNAFISRPDQPLQLANSNSTTSLGELISSKAARKMIQNRFEGELKNPSGLGSQISAYDIGKEAILMILLQEGCEGIRFIPCINPDNENSLVAMGIKSDRKPMREENFALSKLNLPKSENDPIIIEKIGKTSVASLIDEFDKNPPFIPGDISEKISHLTNRMLNIL